MKKWLGLGCIAVIFAILAACSQTGGAPASVVVDEEATQEIIITASNWDYDQAEYQVPVGAAVQLTVQSTEGVHSISIPKHGLNIIHGTSKVVRFDTPGTYEFICGVPCGKGHTTMKAKLIVS